MTSVHLLKWSSKISMKVKVFTKVLKPKLSFWMQPIEQADCGLQDEINLWLSRHTSIEITEIKQTQSGGSFMPATLNITIWYQ
ncbi:conserved hypothetical protein [Shewanella frigidimarina NCIMB 400]|jgi:hypothetical protein|uniref:Uncharacterized protein n=3 Tax=Shewanella frigidimarina TaxID=56812 RepID=Q07X88_SHEFN|nr:conserved hypothetical protein [Shewanella frigidimarina NCIMB 400]